MGSALSSSADKGMSSITSMETSRLIVRQPGKLQELTNLLETFENLSARVSERSSEDRSGDLGGGAGATGGQQGTQGASTRDQAIKNIPAIAVMQEKLVSHIRQEAKRLEKLTHKVARSSDPGSAHTLNELYAKIRRLHSMVYDILQASMDVVKRFFVRVFIDNQPIL